MKISRTIAAAILASALMITLSACEEEGPLEEAGEEIDDAVEDAGDAIEDATNGG
jgi:predicted small lipoprotein YifL